MYASSHLYHGKKGNYFIERIRHFNDVYEECPFFITCWGEVHINRYFLLGLMHFSEKNKQNIEGQKILVETYHDRTFWSETGSNPSKFLCIKLRYRVESSTELGWLRIYTTICIWTKCRSKSPWKLYSVNPIRFRRCKANSHVIARNFRFFSHLNRCHVKARGKTYRILQWFYLSAWIKRIYICLDLIRGL